MIKNLTKSLLFLAILTSFSASASLTKNAIVSSVLIADQNSGAAFINMTTTISGGPACGAANIGRYSVNVNSAAGRAIYAAALLAFSSGKPVDITGSINCVVWGDTEGAMYLNIHN